MNSKSLQSYLPATVVAKTVVRSHVGSFRSGTQRGHSSLIETTATGRRQDDSRWEEREERQCQRCSLFSITSLGSIVVRPPRPRASPTPFSCSIDRSSFSPSGGAAGESISSVEDLLLSEQVIRKNQIDHRKPRT